MHRFLVTLLLVGCAHRGAPAPLAEPAAQSTRYAHGVLAEVDALAGEARENGCPGSLTATLDELVVVMDRAATLVDEPGVTAAQRSLALRQLALGVERGRTLAADCPPVEEAPSADGVVDGREGLETWPRPWQDDPLTLGFDGGRSRPLRPTW